MGIVSQHIAKEWAACAQYDFVGLNLTVLTGQRYVKEILFVPQIAKGDAYIVLKVVPLEAKLFTGHVGRIFSILNSHLIV